MRLLSFYCLRNSHSAGSFLLADRSHPLQSAACATGDVSLLGQSSSIKRQQPYVYV